MHVTGQSVPLMCPLSVFIVAGLLCCCCCCCVLWLVSLHTCVLLINLCQWSTLHDDCVCCSQVTKLLDSMEFVIVPIVNPDGYVVCNTPSLSPFLSTPFPSHITNSFLLHTSSRVQRTHTLCTVCTALCTIDSLLLIIDDVPKRLGVGVLVCINRILRNNV